MPVRMVNSTLIFATWSTNKLGFRVERQTCTCCYYLKNYHCFHFIAIVVSRREKLKVIISEIQNNIWIIKNIMKLNNLKKSRVKFTLLIYPCYKCVLKERVVMCIKIVLQNCFADVQRHEELERSFLTGRGPWEVQNGLKPSFQPACDYKNV
ncbi:hypothetical protein BpHYR1_008365 [Brachionus plicatilis]|uniref:SWIM-type domain-containing protein n=1 Tax=Brachionus plicatilis TaxID=10195 RepID=A0A3M7PXU7_BRAPC|nr:hypothetical protein BpHYR1_008365 [Brachionus plicatilis]